MDVTKTANESANELIKEYGTETPEEYRAYSRPDHKTIAKRVRKPSRERGRQPHAPIKAGSREKQPTITPWGTDLAHMCEDPWP